MSIQAVAWVLDHSRSRGYARLILISLANHHNAGSGRCNPGQRLLAAEAGISSGSVPAQIRALVALGELAVEEAGGSHRSTSYRLTFAQEVSKEHPSFAQPLSEFTKLRSVQTDVCSDSAKVRSVQGRAEPIHQPLEPSRSRDVELVVVPSDPVEIVFRAWQTSTGRSRAVLDAKRKGLIDRALKSWPVEDLVDACRGVSMFAHNRGETNGTRYDDLGLVLRDAEHIERFRDRARGLDVAAAPRLPTGTDMTARNLARMEATRGTP